jgi:TRAP-type C4-dicarboxylate transport system permease small subunit
MKWLQTAVEAVAAVLLAAVAIVVFLQVITRYLLEMSLPWPEEAARYLLVWLVFMGAAAAGAHGQQLVVDTLTEALPRRFQTAVKVVAAIAGLVAIAILVRACLPLFGPAARTASPATGIEMRWVYLALPVGAAFLVVFLLRDLAEAWSGWKRPSGVPNDAGHDGGRDG